MSNKSPLSQVMFALPKGEWTLLADNQNLLLRDSEDQAVIMFRQCEWIVLAWYALSHKEATRLLKVIQTYASSGKPHEYIRLGNNFLDPVEAGSDTGSFSLIEVKRSLQAFVDFNSETDDGEHN